MKYKNDRENDRRTVAVSCAYLMKTAKAVQVISEDMRFWIPKSQISNEIDFNKIKPGSLLVLKIPFWLASKINIEFTELQNEKDIENIEELGEESDLIDSYEFMEKKFKGDL
jgi:hypothetical protein